MPSANPDDRRDRAHVPDRAERAHLRPAHQLRGRASARATKSCAARCASSKARCCRMRRCTRSEERLQRLPYIEKVETETRRVEGTRGSRRRRRDGRRGPVVAARRRHRLFGAPVVHAQRQFRRQQSVRLRRPARARAQRRQVRPGVQRRAHRSVLHRRTASRARSALRTSSASGSPRRSRSSPPQTYSAGSSIGYPISEEQFLNFGLTYSHEDLATSFSSSTQLRDWVRNNGDYYFRRVGSRPGARHHSRHGRDHRRLAVRQPQSLRCFRRAAARIA